MVAKSKTLKSYFLKVLLLSSLIPFFVSISLLWNFISNSNEKINLANNQLKKTYDLEIIDSFHKIQGAMTVLAQSEELKNYFDSTIDSERKNLEELNKVILILQNTLPYANAKWSIINSRGKEIANLPKTNLNTRILKDIEKDRGVVFISKNNQIQFTTPISYKLTADLKSFKKNLGYIMLSLPVMEVQKVFPNLIEFISISKDLDIKNFHTKLKIEYQAESNLYFLYMYIFISFIFIVLATIWSLKIFQKNIVDKILSLRFRVRNEMEFLEKHELRNELDSLSQTFDLYLRYTFFLQKEIFKSSQLAAAGNVAHMIAHDVRKPFSKLQFFMAEIKRSKELKDIFQTVTEFEPSFKSSVEYVEHLLNEVMDARVTMLNIEQSVSFEKIIMKSFQNLSAMPAHCYVAINYDLEMGFSLQVDEIRVTRIIINLISNALEAMNYQGKIWINSKKFELNDKLFLKVTIGNNNSYIPLEYLDHIFEPFFTLKKEKGTGLGLSIAQKIVNLHGGSIQCHSNKETGVEFIFTLPAKKEEMSSMNQFLPEVIKGTKINLTDDNQVFLDNNKYLVVVDDDPLICRTWKRHLADENLIYFLSPEEFFNYYEIHTDFIGHILFIVSDFYFGKDSKYNFYDFIKNLRKIYSGKVFLSSDIKLNEEPDLKNFDIIIIEKRVYTISELTQLSRNSLD
ncbi:ATP-binding protein [Silvanigrella aquatica]|uniref:histidine kinase n=1 Tax=Silvanigrella aquatica TaxID=1915309 RepID=A0A1L4CY87_9BACT|nr:HAMP domain-containing sensor histidine kinase [Silvanigrella aquatica]APJ02912.1 hypothetical protein AXG55_02850 [Silvanigrella aquatica]